MNTEINIDTGNDFFNPFSESGILDSRESLCLYQNYFSMQANRNYLKEISNNTIVSSEDETKDWTRSEVLRSLACYFGYRQKLTTVTRNILNNYYGVVVNYVDGDNTKMETGLAHTIKIKWSKVFDAYNRMRVKNPGMIQLVNVSKQYDRFPLYICNFFGKNKNEDNPYKKAKRAEDYHIRRGLAKLTKIKRSIGNELPIYFPRGMSCKGDSKKWERVSKYIMKYFPEAIICES